MNNKRETLAVTRIFYEVRGQNIVISLNSQKFRTNREAPHQKMAVH